MAAESYIGKAIKYNQWLKLMRYIEDGQLVIDNNITERDISRLLLVEKIDYSQNR